MEWIPKHCGGVGVDVAASELVLVVCVLDEEFHVEMPLRPKDDLVDKGRVDANEERDALEVDDAEGQVWKRRSHNEVTTSILVFHRLAEDFVGTDGKQQIIAWLAIQLVLVAVVEQASAEFCQRCITIAGGPCITDVSEHSDISQKIG
jgi:hypothetical protein